METPQVLFTFNNVCMSYENCCNLIFALVFPWNTRLHYDDYNGISKTPNY
jgi:hypothetical protein